MSKRWDVDTTRIIQKIGEATGIGTGVKSVDCLYTTYRFQYDAIESDHKSESESQTESEHKSESQIENKHESWIESEHESRIESLIESEHKSESENLIGIELVNESQGKG